MHFKYDFGHSCHIQDLFFCNLGETFYLKGRYMVRLRVMLPWWFAYDGTQAIMTSLGLNTYFDVPECMNAWWKFRKFQLAKTMTHIRSIQRGKYLKITELFQRV